MFIRFEDKSGCGVYQGDTDFSDPKFCGIFNLLGAVTRSPRGYQGMIEGDPCRGADHHFAKFLKPGNKFAWKYDFFLRVTNGNLHKHELDVIHQFDWDVKFLNTDNIRKKFIEGCSAKRINILLIESSVLAESEQQVVYDDRSVDKVGEINEHKLFVLSDAFHKLKNNIELFKKR